LWDWLITSLNLNFSPIIINAIANIVKNGDEKYKNYDIADPSSIKNIVGAIICSNANIRNAADVSFDAEKLISFFKCFIYFPKEYIVKIFKDKDF
jgi:hypothetical protein